MNNFRAMRGVRLLGGSALLVIAGLAQAQYMWIDERGVKQFSDRPPPPSSPLKNILKAPGRVLEVPLVPGAEPPVPAPDAAASAPKPKAPLTVAERNADFKKRAKEQAEKDQKAADEAERKSAKAQNCDAARATKAELDSGVRISNIGKNGERGYLTDAERAERAAKANKAIEAACN